MSELVHPLHRFIRPSVKYSTFCPGCGDGTVTQSILRASTDSAWSWTILSSCPELAVRHGFPALLQCGCASHHHGSPLLCLRIKMGLPDKKVMVISGDGDLVAIGGNH